MEWVQEKRYEKAGKIKRRLPRIPGSRKNGAWVCKGKCTSGRRGRIRKPRHLCKRKSCVKTGWQGLCCMHEEGHCPVPDRNKADDRRLKHSGCAHRFSASWRKTESTVWGQRIYISWYPLLRWHQKMAVGNASACNPRCCSQEGWRSSGCSHRRGW